MLIGIEVKKISTVFILCVIIYLFILFILFFDELNWVWISKDEDTQLFNGRKPFALENFFDASTKKNTSSRSLIEDTLAFGLDPNERYLSWSFRYGRWNNNLLQLQNTMALARLTNRSVLAIDFYKQPPDKWFDYEDLKKFLHPHRLLYLPALILNNNNQTQNASHNKIMFEEYQSDKEAAQKGGKKWGWGVSLIRRPNFNDTYLLKDHCLSAKAVADVSHHNGLWWHDNHRVIFFDEWSELIAHVALPSNSSSVIKNPKNVSETKQRGEPWVLLCGLVAFYINSYRNTHFDLPRPLMLYREEYIKEAMDIIETRLLPFDPSKNLFLFSPLSNLTLRLHALSRIATIPLLSTTTTLTTTSHTTTTTKNRNK